MAVDQNIGIQMNQKEITETFMMSSKWKALQSPWLKKKKFNVVRVRTTI